MALTTKEQIALAKAQAHVAIGSGNATLATSLAIDNENIRRDAVRGVNIVRKIHRIYFQNTQSNIVRVNLATQDDAAANDAALNKAVILEGPGSTMVLEPPFPEEPVLDARASATVRRLSAWMELISGAALAASNVDIDLEYYDDIN